MGTNAGDTVIAPGGANIQVFTSSGTWNKPNGVRAARVRVVGAGGGSGAGQGAGSGQYNTGGGGGGGYAEQYILAANLLSSEPVTVGVAGAGGAPGLNNGISGGTSSFGTHCSATGGTGGAANTATAGSQQTNGGVGGAGSGGDLNVQGSDGGYGDVVSGTALKNGFGGPSVLGGSARQSVSGGITNTGKNYGGGGAGIFGAAANAAGSAGAGGVVIVESIF